MKKRILFAKLGHFSYVNDEVANQIVKNFRTHDLVVVDLKDYAKRSRTMAAYNLVTEVATFGPSVLRSRGDMLSFFFRTPTMFRYLSSMLAQECAPLIPDLAFTVQTQGIFSSHFMGIPNLIYTDYTILNTLDFTNPDTRLFRSEAFLRYEKNLYRGADGIAVSGRHVQRVLVDRYGCDPTKVQTVHVGANVDVGPIPNDGTRRAAKHVLFVGVEWKRKGGPALLEGFRLAAQAHPDARLTIVGCSPDLSDPRIRVVGPVRRSQMTGFYETASVFCMPSVMEPLGIAAVEASLFGLPVVATRIDGFLESVTDGETGILVPVNDPGAIASALSRLFANPAEARRMGEAGLVRNRKRFDWDEVGRRLRGMVETIVPELGASAKTAA